MSDSRLKKVWFVGWFASMLLASCGVKNQDATISTLETTCDWKQQGFVTEGPYEEQQLFVVDYEELKYSKPENTYASEECQAARNKDFYILDNHYALEGTFSNFQVWGEDMDLTSSLQPEQWGILDGNILGMDVVNPETVVFFVSTDAIKDSNNRSATEHYYLVYTDEEGNKQKSIDIINSLKDYGIWEDRPIAYVGTQINCDEWGNIYIGDGDRHSIYLLDEAGELITHYTYQAGERDNVLHSFRTDTGEILFAHATGEKISYLWINPENGEEKQLSFTEREYIREYHGMYGNVLYYTNSDSLIGWNVATGEKQILFQLQDYEISDAARVCFMRSGDTGKLLITENMRRYILSLDEREAEVAGEIVVANACGENAFLKGRVFNFSKENPVYGISYEEAYESEEDVARILMEVMNGKGPDILYISQTDMENLYEKMALGDLKQLLTRDTLEVFLPGAVQMGTIDEELAGLPLAVSIRTTITNREYWQQNTWTVRDVLALLEERKESGIFIDYFGQDSFFYNMLFMVGINMADTSYLAEEAGFQCAEFREVLRTVKERTGKVRKMNSFGEFGEALKAGELLAVEAKIFDIRSFATAYDKIGSDTCFVGYPTESGNGNYMESGGLLVVNRAAMEKEGVKELVQYFFDKDSQRLVKDAISVRWDLPAEQLQYDASGEHYFWVYPEGTNILLPDKFDGSSYLEEYEEFIKGAVPRKAISQEIFNIVMEEAESYFSSDKEISEVTNTIQSRLELYQEEHREDE
ncbi:MAG: extracellular solute-binding protein [Lachnospiraceae bacterium]|nr:extracellular solute-binding protein [Lachnospiraceae bacterium]